MGKFARLRMIWNRLIHIQEIAVHPLIIHMGRKKAITVVFLDIGYEIFGMILPDGLYIPRQVFLPELTRSGRHTAQFQVARPHTDIFFVIHDGTLLFCRCGSPRHHPFYTACVRRTGKTLYTRSFPSTIR